MSEVGRNEMTLSLSVGWERRRLRIGEPVRVVGAVREVIDGHLLRDVKLMLFEERKAVVHDEIANVLLRAEESIKLKSYTKS